MHVRNSSRIIENAKKHGLIKEEKIGAMVWMRQGNLALLVTATTIQFSLSTFELPLCPKVNTQIRKGGVTHRLVLLDKISYHQEKASLELYSHKWTWSPD